MSTKKNINTTQLALVLAIITLMSKVLGVTRELFLANYYGASAITDAYTMSLSIPNNLLTGIMGAAGTAFLPIYSRKMETEGKESGDLFTSQIMNLLLTLTAIVTAFGWVFAKSLVKLFAPGFANQTAELTVFYLRIAFIMVFFTAIAQIIEAYLSYRNIFISQQLFIFSYNFSIIAFIIASAKLGMPKLLIFGITIGYGGIALGKLIIAFKNGYRYKPSFDFTGPVKEIVALAVPVFIGNSAMEINALIDRILASNLAEGSVSALNYGMLFTCTFTGVTVAVFVMIIYPRLTKAFSQNELNTISDISERGINLIALIMLPCTLGAMAYAYPVVQVVYERGAFNGAATELTSTAFFYYAIGMSFTAIKMFLDKISYSLRDSKTPVMCTIVGVVVNITLNLILVKSMAHAGLALATSISQIVSAGLEYYWFGKKNPEITLLRSKRKLAKICIFTVVSVGISYAFYIFVGNAIWMPRMVLLGFAVLIAVGIYMLLLYIFKFEELKLFKDLLGRKKN